MKSTVCQFTTRFLTLFGLLASSSFSLFAALESLTYEDGDIKGNVIWCSPDGNDDFADGSEDFPFFDVQKAIDIAQPGDRIWMKAGTYIYDKRINIDDRNGEPDMMIELWGYNGRAILDFSGQPYHPHADNPYQGVRLTSSYWHLKNLDICNASDNGLLIERNKPIPGGTAQDVLNRPQDGHDNVIEACNFYRNGDTGLQIKNLGEYNKIINCDSYFNCDEGHGDADGFAPKISVGTGNYFYGCRAWMNSDDGWDSYYKNEGNFGDDMVIVLENCICYKNGYLEDGTRSGGNGNGFKCGSKEGASNMYLNRCVAYGNTSKGFDQNSNLGDIILNNCTAMDNLDRNYAVYSSMLSPGHEIKMTNCIEIGVSPATYNQFEDLGFSEQLIAPRQEDGSLPQGTFLRLREGSSLIDKGEKVETTSYRGVPVNPIYYLGDAPDLGAYEFGDVGTGVKHVLAEPEGNLSVFQSAGGIIFLTVKGQPANEHFTASVFDESGRIVARHSFIGSTTSLDPSSIGKGLLIIMVENESGHVGSVKTIK